MNRKVSFAAAAGLMLFASPAMAQIGVGTNVGVGPGGAGSNLGVGVGQPGSGVNVGVGADVRTNTAPVTTPNSSVSANASGAVDLSGLNVGTPIRDASGAAVGTVRQVVRSADGAVTGVVVRARDGARRTLQPGSLSVDGGVWTSTEVATPTPQ